MNVFEQWDTRNVEIQREWKKLFEKLREFIAENCSTKIQHNTIDISEDVRPAFYNLFDKVRDMFIYEEFPELIEEAEFLSKAYINSEQKLTDLLNLEEILMPNDVQRFLHEPLKQMRREIFDLLFDLLNGRIDMGEFISTAKANVTSSFRQLYRQGYEKWVVLSLLMQFEPDKVFSVPVIKPTSKQIIKRSVTAKESLPLPVETKRIYFEVGGSDVLLIPDVIVHSTVIDKYVAFRTELGKAMWKANRFNNKREWYSIMSLMEKFGISNIRPDLLIYVGDNLEDISLISDSENICRPDMCIECIDGVTLNKELLREKLQEAGFINKVLNPVFGGLIVANQKMPEYAHEIFEQEINFIEADFKDPELNLIVNTIKKGLLGQSNLELEKMKL